jgi:hypothetical protein
MVSDPVEASINLTPSVARPVPQTIANKPLILLDFSRGWIMALPSRLTDDRPEPKI